MMQRKLKIHRNNELNWKKRSLFTGKTRHRKVLPCPPVRPHTTPYWPDTGPWERELKWEPSWNRWMFSTLARAHALTHTHTTHMYVVDLCIYSSYPGGVQNLSAILTRHSSISIIAQALEFFFFFPTVYINFSSRRPSRWHQQLRYKPLVMNKIYILKNNPSTTATSGHQIHKKHRKKNN